MHEVPIAPRPSDGFRKLVDESVMRRYERLSEQSARRLRGRVLWQINSAESGGVAELLRSMLGYLRNRGVDTRWLVVDGDERFFAITKRIHNHLHGVPGDGGALGARERSHYDGVLARNMGGLRGHISPGDVVILHDPQTLGLARAVAAEGACVIWTCHIGVDEPNDAVREAWRFFDPDLDAVRLATFTRATYVWEGIEPGRTALIPPCIDAFSLKNADLKPARRDAILVAAGLVAPHPTDAAPTFTRTDGASGLVRTRALMDEDEPMPDGAPYVLQVSRWDRLKDPVGVLRGFVQDGPGDVHLVLAGPAPSSVADDPEADGILSEVRGARSILAPSARRRVHIANLPVDDAEENAVVVNALQRRAEVVVQKSLAEGFGLTVTEAMWKARPVVASRVGGIRDQIEDRRSGRLVDPTDLEAFGRAVASLIERPHDAASMGAAARETVRSRYLAPHYLGGYLELVRRLSAERRGSPPTDPPRRARSR